jgi:hypothetical protein
VRCIGGKRAPPPHQSHSGFATDIVIWMPCCVAGVTATKQIPEAGADASADYSAGRSKVAKFTFAL